MYAPDATLLGKNGAFYSANNNRTESIGNNAENSCLKLPQMSKN